MTTTECDRKELEYVIERTRNRHYRRAAGNRRPNSARARERITLAQWYGNKCFYCDREFNKDMKPTIDHYFPEAFCRANDMPKCLWNHISNKVLACYACNQLKADNVPRIYEFYVWMQRVLSNSYSTSPEVITSAERFLSYKNFVGPWNS